LCNSSNKEKEVSDYEESSKAYYEGLAFGPSDKTRTIASKYPAWAYAYALDVDKGFHAGTRAGARKDPSMAHHYALDIDKGPHNLTREAACTSPTYALKYARYVDKGPQDSTRAAVCEDPWFAYQYAIDVDKQPRDDTWKAVCKSMDKNTVRTYEKFRNEFEKQATNSTNKEIRQIQERLLSLEKTVLDLQSLINHACNIIKADLEQIK